MSSTAAGCEIGQDALAGFIAPGKPNS